MKKYYLLSLLLLLIFSSARAQSGDSWCGVRAGVNFSNLVSSDYNTQYLTGFNVGAVYAVPASKVIPIYIETGLSFQMKGARDRGFLTESLTDSRLEIYALELPVTILYNTPINREWSVQPFVGLYYSIAMAGSAEIGGEWFNPYEKYLLQRFRDNTPQQLQLLHRSDFGMRIGVSTTYRDIFFGVAYDAGFLNIYAPEYRGDGFEASSCSLSLNMGYNF